MKTLTNDDYSKDSPYYYGRGVEVLQPQYKT